MKSFGKSNSGKDIVTHDSLNAKLNTKANTNHTHTIAQITNLQASLDAKAPKTHSHTIGEVTGLQQRLNELSNTNSSGIYLDTAPTSPKNGDILIDTTDNTASDLVNKIYPVGSIYISVVNTNPTTFFGGTWESFAQGRTLVGVGPDSDFNTSMKVGGEKAHTLTKQELPRVDAKFYIHGEGDGTIFHSFQGDATGTKVESKFRNSGNPNNWASSYKSIGVNFGGDQPHNNMQPYITTYMWRRIA